MPAPRWTPSWPTRELTVPRRRDLSALGFLAPYLGLYALFTVAPVLWSLAMSLQRGGLLEGMHFHGLANFARVWRNPLFTTALGNTARYAVITVPGALLLSLGTALLVHPLGRRWQNLVRACLFVPLISSTVALAVVWRALLAPGPHGPVNWLLGLAGLSARNWLGDPALVIPAIAAFEIWRGYGFWVIVLLAGLDAIPRELYEAARVDGASSWHTFRRITLPMLRPSLLFLTVMGCIWSLQLFDPVFMFTRGGPANSSITVVYYIYRSAFHFDNLGYAATMSVVLFALMLGLTAAQMRLGRGGTD